MSRSSVLQVPYDIIAQIIDIVGENDDMNLIKELALVSHSFHQICRKHIFGTVDLCQASSKKGFVKLLKRRPDVVKHIRKLTYEMEYDDRFQSSPLSESSTCPRFDYDDNLLSLIPLLANFLRTISFLNCLTITASMSVNWDTVHSSLTSALLHLMHLPTINHIDISSITNFPLSSLATSKSLRRLDIFLLKLEDVGSPDSIDVLSETMPKIRDFRTTESSLLTTKLLRAKTQDGQPVFSCMELRRLSITSTYHFQDEWYIRYLLQNAKLLEKLCLLVESDESLEGLLEILSPSARTLKELDLTVSLFSIPQPFAKFFRELGEMAGNNILEALSFEIEVFANDNDSETEDFVGSAFQKVEEVLVKPGWSALRQVSFKVRVARWLPDLYDVLQSIPDKYLSHLSKPEPVDFDYEFNLEYHYTDD